MARKSETIVSHVPTEREMKIQAQVLGVKAYAPDLWTFFTGQFAKRHVKAGYLSRVMYQYVFTRKLLSFAFRPLLRILRYRNVEKNSLVDSDSGSEDESIVAALEKDCVDFHAVELLPPVADGYVGAESMQRLRLVANPEADSHVADIMLVKSSGTTTKPKQKKPKQPKHPLPLRSTKASRARADFFRKAAAEEAAPKKIVKSKRSNKLKEVDMVHTSANHDSLIGSPSPSISPPIASASSCETPEKQNNDSPNIKSEYIGKGSVSDPKNAVLEASKPKALSWTERLKRKLIFERNETLGSERQESSRTQVNQSSWSLTSGLLSGGPAWWKGTGSEKTADKLSSEAIPEEDGLASPLDSSIESAVNQNKIGSPDIIATGDAELLVDCENNGLTSLNRGIPPADKLEVSVLKLRNQYMKSELSDCSHGQHAAKAEILPNVTSAGTLSKSPTAGKANEASPKFSIIKSMDENTAYRDSTNGDLSHGKQDSASLQFAVQHEYTTIPRNENPLGVPIQKADNTPNVTSYTNIDLDTVLVTPSKDTPVSKVPKKTKQVPKWKQALEEQQKVSIICICNNELSYSKAIHLQRDKERRKQDRESWIKRKQAQHSQSPQKSAVNSRSPTRATTETKSAQSKTIASPSRGNSSAPYKFVNNHASVPEGSVPVVPASSRSRYLDSKKVVTRRDGAESRPNSSLQSVRSKHHAVYKDFNHVEDGVDFNDDGWLCNDDDFLRDSMKVGFVTSQHIFCDSYF